MMASRAHLILVIDDERQLVRAVRAILETRDYEVIDAADGAQALELLSRRSPDIIVLDLTLPDIDGLDLLLRIRSFSQVPILVLSARVSEQDKVVALTTGADDYLTKPFSAGEFLARIGVLLRRTSGATMVPMLCAGDLVIDFVRRRVTRGEAEVPLTPTEYAILEVLATNPDRVLTWQQIVEAAWGPELEADAATLRVHISNLRRKIEPHPSVPKHLLTEPHVGFRFSTRD